MLEPDIIIIGGADDKIFGPCVHITLLHAAVHSVLFFLDALYAPYCTLTIVVKVFVARLALAQTHVLHICHKLFYLVVCHG